jgi:DNA-binding MarR family transcriptional regulator
VATIVDAGHRMPQPKRQKLPKTPARAGKKRDAIVAVDYTALAQFRYQLRRFLSFSEAAADRAGLTPRQHQALLAIKGFAGKEPVSVGDLARYLLVRHHTAVELVDRMAKLGLLGRTADDADNRRILLKLTAKGEQKLRTLSKVHFEELQSASPGLTRILRSFRDRKSTGLAAPALPSPGMAQVIFPAEKRPH